MTPAEAYERALYPQGCGTALWEPDHIDINPGDVGFIQDDHFTRLFNALLPWTHPEQRLGVPSGFQPMVVPPHLRTFKRLQFEPQILHSQSVKQHDVSAELTAGELIPAGVGFRFTCHNQSGGVLILKQGASRDIIADSPGIHAYILEHLDSWYEFADQQGYLVPKGNIFMVRGCDKAAEWALAAFESSTRSAEMFFNGAFMNVAGARVSLQGSWGSFTSGQHRSGPDHGSGMPLLQPAGPSSSPPAVPSLPFNQPVFLRTWRVRRAAFRFLRTIKAAAEPEDDDYDWERDVSTDPCSVGGGTSDDEMVVELDPSPDPADHPLDVLLDYILDHSTAQTAIVTDENLYGLFQDGRIPDICASVIEQAAPCIRVDNGLVGTVINGAEIDYEQVDFSALPDILMQGPPSPPSVTAWDPDFLIPQSTPTVAPATAEASLASISLRNCCAEPHALTVEDLSPEDIRDVYSDADGSYVETPSAATALELKKRFDRLHGVSLSVPSPWKITSFINQYGKKIYRIELRDMAVPAGSGLDAKDRVLKSRASSHSLGSMFSNAISSKPARPHISRMFGTFNSGGKLRKSQSVPDKLLATGVYRHTLSPTPSPSPSPTQGRRSRVSSTDTSARAN